MCAIGFSLACSIPGPDRQQKTGNQLNPDYRPLRPAEAVARIVKTIAVYDDFCHANDPYEEHDFGSFEVDGHKLFFKIDYLDKSRCYHSPDPSDPSVTERVITIMLAEEY